MVNDAPFVDLPTPPASGVQPVKEADLRGWDHGTDDDEYVRAIAYRVHIVAMTQNKRANLLKLAGSKEAYKSLRRKTVALTESAPPYIEADA